MSIIFMGSPDFAVVSLKRLLSAGLPVAAVVSQPDRPSGRGRKLNPTAVSRFAQEEGIPLYRPRRLRNEQIHSQLASYQPELFVVVAYRILPQAMLGIPLRGSINLHGSLLPLYRGAAPIQKALLNGDTTTGLTTFLLDDKVDTGSILQREQVSVQPDDDCGSLSERMAVQGAELLLTTVQSYLAGRIKPVPQPDGDYQLAPRISAVDRLLKWRETATDLRNRIRALSPRPGCHCRLDGQQLIVFKAEVEEYSGETAAGTVLRSNRRGILVACGEDALLLEDLQLRGRRRMSAASFLNGYSITPGMRIAGGELTEQDRPEE